VPALASVLKQGLVPQMELVLFPASLSVLVLAFLPVFGHMVFHTAVRSMEL
jgi:hypothetical protein